MNYANPNTEISKEAVLKRIELLHIQSKFNQAQHAQELSISQSAISKYLKQRIPPADILLKMARMGHTTIEWILTGEKQHFYSTHYDVVTEKEGLYQTDVDISLAKKIAKLPVDAKQVVTNLINILQGSDYR